MNDAAHQTYPPLNTLKPVSDDIWIVDGPLIGFGPPLFRMPFPTRMTVVRIGRDLLIHSPTALVPELKAEIEAAGQVRWIVGPNRIHYWWIPDWHRAFPGAEVYLAPRIREQAGDRIDFHCMTLDHDSGYLWDAEVATSRLVGSYMTEVVFFHRPSRTLILTDAIENFEPRKIDSLWVRWLTWFGGVQDPDGQMPRDMRFTYRQNRRQLRKAVETMIGWNPERVILAHGRWYDHSGADEMRRAFRWLLD